MTLPGPALELSFDVLVLGAGPAGHRAAIQAAKAGARVLLVDREPAVGGECVQRGTIPSKTLRESASYLVGLRFRSDGVLGNAAPAKTRVASLMRRLATVREKHHTFLDDQLERNGIERMRGRARFLSSELAEIRSPDRSVRRVRAKEFVIATGSRPRRPDHVPVDHEHVLDSDSILSLIYLPASLTILGGGVIACEFASIFAALGVHVTQVDAGARPLGFLEEELTDGYAAALERMGGCFISGQKTRAVRWNGVEVETECENGEIVRSEKLLCALGRMANVQDLGLDAAGVEVSTRGHVIVDSFMRTRTPHIYAVGDVVGPPALAATAIEQGRRAMRHALGLPLDQIGDLVPIGIYTIPEIASIGLSEAQAIEKYGSACVGRAHFDEVARAHINGRTDGLLKLVADPGGRIVGTQIVGEAATELVHVAQIAIVGGLSLEAFVENVFNFPTMAEAYRVAAIDAVARRAALQSAA